MTLNCILEDKLKTFVISQPNHFWSGQNKVHDQTELWKSAIYQFSMPESVFRTFRTKAADSTAESTCCPKWPSALITKLQIKMSACKGHPKGSINSYSCSYYCYGRCYWGGFWKKGGPKERVENGEMYDENMFTSVKIAEVSRAGCLWHQLHQKPWHLSPPEQYFQGVAEFVVQIKKTI